MDVTAGTRSVATVAVEQGLRPTEVRPLPYMVFAVKCWQTVSPPSRIL